MALIEPYDPATPAGNTDRSLGDDRIRELKRALTERLIRVWPNWPNGDPLTWASGIVPGSAIPNDGITGSKIADDSITSGKIADLAVLDAHIAAMAASKLTGTGLPVNIVDSYLQKIRGIYHAPFIAGRNAVAVGTGAAIIFTPLHTIQVPANSMGLQGGIRVVGCVSNTGAAGPKQLKVTFGGAQLFAVNFASNETGFFELLVFNRNVANAQIFDGWICTGSPGTFTRIPRATPAVDTTINQDVQVLGQTDNAADEVTAEVTTVEVLPS